MARVVAKIEYTCRACPEVDGRRERFDNPLQHIVQTHPNHLLQAPLGMLYDQIMVVPVYEDIPVQTLDKEKKAS